MFLLIQGEGELSWQFGGEARLGDDPFGGELQEQLSWNAADCEFEPQGKYHHLPFFISCLHLLTNTNALKRLLLS